MSADIHVRLVCDSCGAMMTKQTGPNHVDNTLEIMRQKAVRLGWRIGISTDRCADCEHGVSTPKPKSKNQQQPQDVFPSTRRVLTSKPR